MIKLTALHFKLKTSSLERFHNISQYNEGLMFNWEAEVERSRNTSTEYPNKPFIEPFEFEDDDYEITEQSFRIRPKDVLFYKTNLENLTEITLSGDISFTVRESVEEIDKLFFE